MNLDKTVSVNLEKGMTKKVNCFIFKSKELGRELAVHESCSNKNLTSISDIKTGLRLCFIDLPIKSVKEDDIKNRLNEFIKHFTLKEIKARFEELDNIEIIEKKNGKKN